MITRSASRRGSSFRRGRTRRCQACSSRSQAFHGIGSAGARGPRPSAAPERRPSARGFVLRLQAVDHRLRVLAVVARRASCSRPACTSGRRPSARVRSRSEFAVERGIRRGSALGGERHADARERLPASPPLRRGCRARAGPSSGETRGASARSACAASDDVRELRPGLAGRGADPGRRRADGVPGRRGEGLGTVRLAAARARRGGRGRSPCRSRRGRRRRQRFARSSSGEASSFSLSASPTRSRGAFASAVSRTSRCGSLRTCGLSPWSASGTAPRWSVHSARLIGCAMRQRSWRSRRSARRWRRSRH